MARKIIFFILTSLVFSSAWLVSEQKKASTSITKSILYPNLLENFSQVAQIKIRNNEKEITLKKLGKQWVISENDNFLAKPELIRGTLLQIARLKKIEKKSTSDAGHRILGVNNLGEEGIPRQQITFSTSSNKTLASLIIGKKIADTTSERYFARKSGEAQSWVIEGAIDFLAHPIAWVDSRIMNIEPEMIKSVVIEARGSPTITVTKTNRSKTLFTLQDIPEGGKPKSATLISSFGSLLNDLRFDDVLSSKRLGDDVPIRSTTVQLFENFGIILLDYSLRGKVYTKIKIENLQSGDTTTNIDYSKYALNDEHQKWVYLLPRYKRRIIERKITSLFQK